MRKRLPPGIRDWLGLRSRRLALALDYDGTLVPITQRPQEAHPDRELLNLLHELAQEAVVVILTGRDRRAIESWLPDPIITIVATHGAEWRQDGLWKPLLVIRETHAPLKVLTKKLEESFGDTSGVIIESKGISVAFHYRLVNPYRRSDLLSRFEEIVSQWLQDNEGFELLKGKCVREIRPQGVDKGRALQRVRERLGASDVPLLAMGDDRTDQDMFRCLSDGDLSILIGPRDGSAAVHLKDVWEAREVLKGILRIRQKSGVGSQK